MNPTDDSGPPAFEFATATRIVFGRGAARQMGPLAAEWGRRPLIVTGSDPDRFPEATSSLRGGGLEPTWLSMSGEPTVDSVRRGVEAARSAGADSVVALGGGSAIDGGKAIAALAANPGDLLDYLEVVGRGQPLVERPLPFVAVATTSGTGAEATRNAVVASPEHRVKASLRHAWMLPRAAVVDPDLTLGLPPQVTAATGMDALTQCLEPFVSKRANPMTDALCLEGLRRAAGALRSAYRDGGDPRARSDMSLASLLGGLALANAGLGAVHGFAGPIGGMFAAPHGAVCAALLPAVVRVNATALRERDPDSRALERYAAVARLVCGRPDATVSDLIVWIEALAADLDIPGLASFGVREGDFDEIVRKSERASSMKPNPAALTREELRAVLEQSLSDAA